MNGRNDHTVEVPGYGLVIVRCRRRRTFREVWRASTPYLWLRSNRLSMWWWQKHE